MSDTLTEHIYSPSTKTFFATSLRHVYHQAGTWPSDAVPVSDETYVKYALGETPKGMTRGADERTGQPIWEQLPPPPPPTLAQQAAMMLAAGIQIVSDGAPSLNGTYPCDQLTHSHDMILLSSIMSGLKLPDGVVERVDTSGNLHGFFEGDFKNFCQAKLAFVHTLTTIQATNAGALPQQPSVIP